ncbi:MAG: hypothetical protein AVDCRST_MAG35-2100 [uncultured Quadrisphaera sp.]|uniref:Uncharacterized protein n=1 Tax=uncultured Quadrisphaera sp. TaxID=904978 RepID=A0A6J4PV63_9ACTN|nr:MAG: hypothetical protein AVDCRST_MAG35-2100 [uncultured Quadrisphaera sp.]
MAPEPAPEPHGTAHPAEPDAARTPGAGAAPSDRTDRTVLRSVANPRRTRLL